jgi:hypothetical protein
MAEEKAAVSLETVVAGLLHAVRNAKRAGDLESARLLEVYKKERALSSFSVPAYTIADVDIELRFSVAGVQEGKGEEGEIPNLRVKITPEALKGLEAHQVSVMRLKISPVSLRVFEETT